MGSKDKTKKHSIDEKLRMLAMAVEQSMDGIAVADVDGNIKFANRKWAKMHGYKLSELIGKHLSIFHTKKQMKKDVIPFNKQVWKIGTHHGEVGHVKKNRTIFQTWMSTTLLKDKKGKPVGLVGIVRDITERKKAEREILLTKERLNYLLSSTTAVVYASKASGDYGATFISDNVFRVTGYKPQAFIKNSNFWIKHVHPDDRQRVLKEVRHVFKERVHIYEYRFLCKNGRYIWISDEMKCVRDNKGQPIEIIGYWMNITKRRKREEELQIQSQILLNMAEGVNVADDKRKIFFTNPRFDTMFGYKHGELIGRNVSILNRLAPKENARLINKIIKHMKQKDHWSGEFINRKKDGTKLITHARISTIEMYGKTYYISVQKDITDQKKMDENLKKLNKELLKSNEKLKQMSLRDPQTGLYNHHYLPKAIETEFYRARRYVHPFSIIMLDIDYFKSINDVYGHKFGDLVLKQVAKQITKVVRRYDTTIRFGGEEFVVLSPSTDRSTALTLARRLLDSLKLRNFGNKKQIIKLTFSIAVISYPEDRIIKHMDLIDLAEHVLDKVKKDGGDRVYSLPYIKNGKVAASTTVQKEDTPEVKFLKKRLEKLNTESKQNLFESIFAFAKTIEVKDHYTGEHVERTVYYAAAIARSLGLPEEEVMHIKQAAILHDLGKVGISEKILLKKAKLNKKEFGEIMRHPQIGTDIIRPIKFLHDIIPLILYHHENWDGKGYPTGLGGQDIPVGARIISIADVYQALISDRPYRGAFSKPKAMKIIRELSGTKFDPNVAKAFLSILKRETE